MNLNFFIDTAHGGTLYSISYTVSILLSAVLSFYAGVKRGYPKLTWLLIMMTGGLFFILGEKIASWSPGQWATVFYGFELPRTEKKTILGGIIGLFTGLILAKGWFRFHRPVLDNFAVALPLAMAVSRIGCLMAGCCFGTTTDLPWGIRYGAKSMAYNAHVLNGMVHLHDTSSALIHPVQVYEMLGCVVIAFFIWKTRNKWKAGGSLFLCSVLSYAMLRFLMEFIRAPESSFVLVSVYAGLKAIQWVILAVILSGLAVLIIRETKARSKAVFAGAIQVKPFRQFLLVAFFIAVAFSGRKWFSSTEFTVMQIFLIPVVFIMIGKVFQKHIQFVFRRLQTGLWKRKEIQT
jgi:prolipoprotein diacylglyceryltransferase